MASVVFGLGAILIGFYGVWTWKTDLIHFMKGMLPISLFFAGIISLIAGLVSLLAKNPPPGSKKGS